MAGPNVQKREEKKRDYDPILDDPLSEGSDEEKKEGDSESGGSDSDVSEEAIDIEFPRDDADDLLVHLHRELTNMSNLEDG